MNMAFLSDSPPAEQQRLDTRFDPSTLRKLTFNNIQDGTITAFGVIDSVIESQSVGLSRR